MIRPASHPLADRYTKDNAARELEGAREKLSGAKFDSLVEHGRSQSLNSILNKQLGI